MSIACLEREGQKLLKSGRINRNGARRLADLVLEDEFVSRSERRYINGLLWTDKCDEEAMHIFIDLLLSGKGRCQTWTKSYPSCI